jgi:hypothetical protein
MLLLCRVGRKLRLWPVAAGYVVRTAVCSAATRPAAQDGNTTRVEAGAQHPPAPKCTGLLGVHVDVRA